MPANRPVFTPRPPGRFAAGGGVPNAADHSPAGPGEPNAADHSPATLARGSNPDPVMRSDELVCLYVQFAGRLARIVGGCFDASDAVIEDACAAAWTRLIQNRRRMVLGTAPGWLIRTALHEARRLRLLEARDDSLELELELELGENPGPAVGVPPPGPDELLARRERLRAVGALPTRQQRLVWLLALGLSYDEIAWHERCTSRTVHRQLERARRRLRVLDEVGLRRPSLSGPVRACDASAQPG